MNNNEQKKGTISQAKTDIKLTDDQLKLITAGGIGAPVIKSFCCGKAVDDVFVDFLD